MGHAVLDGLGDKPEHGSDTTISRSVAGAVSLGLEIGYGRITDVCCHRNGRCIF